MKYLLSLGIIMPLANLDTDYIIVLTLRNLAQELPFKHRAKRQLLTFRTLADKVL